jgi:hypothetical protein
LGLLQEICRSVLDDMAGSSEARACQRIRHYSICAKDCVVLHEKKGRESMYICQIWNRKITMTRRCFHYLIGRSLNSESLSAACEMDIAEHGWNVVSVTTSHNNVF